MKYFLSLGKHGYWRVLVNWKKNTEEYRLSLPMISKVQGRVIKELYLFDSLKEAKEVSRIIKTHEILGVGISVPNNPLIKNWKTLDVVINSIKR